MSADCALITALPRELDAILFHFRHWRRTTHSGSSGVFFETTSPNGLRLVAATSLGAGQLHAATAAYDIVRRYSPRIVLLVGITGGLDREVNLGDVVASEQIVDYELGKVSPAGFTPRWRVYQCDAGLVNRAHAHRNEPWQKHIRTPRPDGKHSSLSALHTGVYLSGNKVIADETTAGALKAMWRKATAIEMEAAGVAAALNAMPGSPAFIVLKGLCDYADSTKNDDWQEYAADAAASCAVSFVAEQLAPSDLASTSSAANPQPITEAGLHPRLLRLVLAQAFSLGELRVLCHDLDIDWDDIAGHRKSERIVDLISHLKRRNRLGHLVDLVNRERDNILNAYASNDFA